MASRILFADLIGQLYSAAVHPELWQPWFADLCRKLRAPAGALILRFEPGIGHHGAFSVGIRHDLGASYVSHLACDHRIFKAVFDLAPSEFMNLSETVPASEFLQSRFYTEWMHPQNLRHLLVGMVHRTPHHMSGLGFLRCRGAQPFGRRELDLLHGLAPHIQRAVHVQELVAAAEFKTRAMERSLDALPFGAAVVDGDGTVLGSNRRAEALFERKDGLRLEAGRLRGERAEDSAALLHLIVEAVNDPEASRLQRAGVLTVSRADDVGPLVAFVTPLRAAVLGVPWLEQGVALVLMSDPVDLPQLAEAGLRRIYGLTQAEARVAAHIALGRSVEEIAATLDVKVSTVRSQLAQIFAKTETRRQAELVRLLLTGPVMLEGV